MSMLSSKSGSPSILGLHMLERSGDHVLVPAGQVIFTEGEPGKVMFVVIEGEISVSVEGRQVDWLHAGSVVGEMALIDDRPRSATATAAIDCTLLPVDMQRFLALVREIPDFAVEVMTIMSVRVRRLLEEEIKRQRMEEELAIGRQIQHSLLPESCPQISGWEFAAVYQAARQVGGDLYDFIPGPDKPERLTIAIADVTGKGVPAALFMALSRTLIRVEALNGQGPAAVLERVNRYILQDSQSRLFLSAFCAALNTRTGELVYANGGHEWPLWLRGAREIEPLVAPGVLLGAFADIPLEERTVQVAPGDSLVFFTDGLTEARDAAGQMFGEERLRETILAAPSAGAQQLLESIVAAAGNFAGDTPSADDFTLVVAHRA